MASCPGLHFAVIICTNSARRELSPSQAEPAVLPAPGARRTCPTQLTFIVDLAISINVSLSDHLIHLLVRQLLPQVRHDVTQLGGTDIAIPILGFGDKGLSLRLPCLESCGGQGLPTASPHLGEGALKVQRGLWLAVRPCHRALSRTAYLVKDTEGLSDLLLTVCVLHLSGHHGQELWEVNGPIPWRREGEKEGGRSYLGPWRRGNSSEVTSEQRGWAGSQELTVSVHLIDHVLQFGLSGVLPQRPHHSPQLLGSNGAIPILVEEGEGFLELWGGKGMCQEPRG